MYSPRRISEPKHRGTRRLLPDPGRDAVVAVIAAEAKPPVPVCFPARPRVPNRPDQLVQVPERRPGREIRTQQPTAVSPGLTVPEPRPDDRANARVGET